MMRFRQLAISLTIGACISMILTAAVYLVFPRWVFMQGWLAVGWPLGTLLSNIAPDLFRSWMIGEFGMFAELVAIELGAVLTWSLIFAFLFSVWRAWWGRSRLSNRVDG